MKEFTCPKCKLSRGEDCFRLKDNIRLTDKPCYFCTDRKVNGEYLGSLGVNPAEDYAGLSTEHKAFMKNFDDGLYKGYNLDAGIFPKEDHKQLFKDAHLRRQDAYNQPFLQSYDGVLDDDGNFASEDEINQMIYGYQSDED